MKRRIAGQGTLLFCGFGFAQACSFLRNALIGSWLAKGDFGVAATIILVLQLLDTLSDLGADRLIVQAHDGDDERMLSSAHSILALRGLITAAIVYGTAGPVSSFFGVGSAQWAFEAAALVPLVKGFQSLDSRRQQRHLANGPAVAIEIAPQLATLALTVPVLLLRTDYSAVLWLSLLQAGLALMTSHAVAKRRYHLGFDRQLVKRMVNFGWPIWISAFPLVAVYQGDRILIGHLMGMDQLAGYSAAFMLTMVPGLLAGKVCQALLLPLLSTVGADQAAFRARTLLMAEGLIMVAAGYAMLLVVAGGEALALAFGPQYAGLGGLVGWLGIMWALRMVQAVPGLALMALGETRPLLTAGAIRACALPFAAALACNEAGLAAVAAAGAAGELASLIYICCRIGRRDAALTPAVLCRVLFLVPIGICAVSAATAISGAGWAVNLAAGIALGVAAMLAGAAVMPGARRILESGRDDWRQARAGAPSSRGTLAAWHGAGQHHHPSK